MRERKSRVKPCRVAQSSRRDVACVIRVIGVYGMTGDQVIRTNMRSHTIAVYPQQGQPFSQEKR